MDANLSTAIGDNGIRVVLQDDIPIGTLYNFCCGVDFRPDGKRCLFSILHLKADNSKVLDCVTEILQLKLDRISGHYNYQHPDNRKQTFEQIKENFEERYYGR